VVEEEEEGEGEGEVGRAYDKERGSGGGKIDLISDWCTAAGSSSYIIHLPSHWRVILRNWANKYMEELT